jgi:hypothetical protein
MDTWDEDPETQKKERYEDPWKRADHFNDFSLDDRDTYGKQRKASCSSQADPPTFCTYIQWKSFMENQDYDNAGECERRYSFSDSGDGGFPYWTKGYRSTNLEKANMQITDGKLLHIRPGRKSDEALKNELAVQVFPNPDGTPGVVNGTVYEMVDLAAMDLEMTDAEEWDKADPPLTCEEWEMETTSNSHTADETGWTGSTHATFTPKNMAEHPWWKLELSKPYTFNRLDIEFWFECNLPKAKWVLEDSCTVHVYAHLDEHVWGNAANSVEVGVVDPEIDAVNVANGVHHVHMKRGLEGEHRWTGAPTKAKYVTLQMEGTGRIKVSPTSLVVQYYCMDGAIGEDCREDIYCDGHAKGNCP